MQKPNDKRTSWTMISVPTEMLEEVGIDEFSGIQFSVARGRLMLEPLEADAECDLCPRRGCCEEARL